MIMRFRRLATRQKRNSAVRRARGLPTSRNGGYSRGMIKIARLLALISALMLPTRAAERLNIVWILVDDMSADFSCYGNKVIRTPNVDRLAAEGTRFTRASVTAPICSICRSALITGRYQTSIGCQNHRSGSAKFPIRLAMDTPVVPQLFKEAGYHTNNLSIEDFLRADAAAGSKVKIAKTDYNFVWDQAATYDGIHWTTRKPGQPFFVQVQLHGGKHRGQAPGQAWPAKVKKTLGDITPEPAVKLPPYLPDDPVIRADWAQYLDCVRYTDWEVGRIIERLKDAGELDRTVIFFMADHGISHVRNKQFLYQGGLHVPLVVRGPGISAGKVRADLVEHIDLAAASLALAELPIPATMEGQDVFSKDYQPRKYTFGARDRADETVDRIRSVCSERYKYIRNHYPSRPYLQPNRYKDSKAVVQAMRRLHAEKKLTPEQSLIMAATRPREEFYDLETDPHELHNIAADPAMAGALAEHRHQLDEWIARTNDKGRTPEPEEVYLNYVNDERPEGGKGGKGGVFAENIALMLRWVKEKPMEP
jgi:arylsulfatase A-like enzyme